MRMVKRKYESQGKNYCILCTYALYVTELTCKKFKIEQDEQEEAAAGVEEELQILEKGQYNFLHI